MFGVDSRGEVWVYGCTGPGGLLAAARGAGSPCLELQSWQLLVEGGVVTSPSAAGPREGGHNGEPKVLVTLWGWAARAEQDVIVSFGRWLVLLLVPH